jgi:hypothetical protein
MHRLVRKNIFFYALDPSTLDMFLRRWVPASSLHEIPLSRPSSLSWCAGVDHGWIMQSKKMPLPGGSQPTQRRMQMPNSWDPPSAASEANAKFLRSSNSQPHQYDSMWHVLWNSKQFSLMHVLMCLSELAWIKQDWIAPAAGLGWDLRRRHRICSPGSAPKWRGQHL